MEMAHKRIVLISLTIRVWHFVHAVCIILLILTGIQLRVPDIFTLFGTLRNAVQLHNIFGFIVTFDYLLWFGYYVMKRELVLHYIPTIEDFLQGTTRQASYYFFRIFLGDPPPFQPTLEAKFNSMQKVSYFGIMFLMLPLQIFTGILLWDLEQFLPVIGALGGVRVVDALHVILAYVFTAFLIAHIYLSTLGHTFFAHFKAAVLGYEE